MEKSSVSERMAAGKALRSKVPHERHADYQPAPDRADPVAILETQAKTRLPVLVPIRYARMLASPFAFLRGSAAVMAADLAHTPVTGLTVQACGDMHVANFGGGCVPGLKAGITGAVLVAQQLDWEDDVLERLPFPDLIKGSKNGRKQPILLLKTSHGSDEFHSCAGF